MNFHLDNKIQLNQVSEYPGLYSWSLHELNEKGEKVGRDQIPWNWSLYFTASELRYICSIDNQDSCLSEHDEKGPTSQESERILGILHPGKCSIDGKELEDDVSYSMFGTNRKINTFRLIINKLKQDHDQEHCQLWGCVSYTSELDFQYNTTDDIVEINLNLSPQRFNKIANLTKEHLIDILEIRISGASGLYSEWSPSISTTKIKVLADSEPQEIIINDGSQIAPPRLGVVCEFDITVIKRHLLNLKQDLRSINVNNLFDNSNDHEEIDIQTAGQNKNSLILSKLANMETTLEKLRFPIWLIFIALCFLLIK